MFPDSSTILIAALVVSGCLGCNSSEYAASPPPPRKAATAPMLPVGDKAEAATAAPTPPIGDMPGELSATSTLQQWNTASAGARSRVAVALARDRLGPDASKLDVAKAAMEITGCLSNTASDAKLAGWSVGGTAATCLSPPQPREPS